MSQRLKTISVFGGISMIGATIPFIEYLAIIEVFVLGVPFIILLIASVAYLLGRLIFRGQNDDHAWLLAWIMPVLFASQVFSVYAVNKVQRFRADQLVRTIMSSKIVPVCNTESFGLSINSAADSTTFSIEYSSGFFVREVYSSKTRTWSSYGWND